MIFFVFFFVGLLWPVILLWWLVSKSWEAICRK